MFYTCMQTTVNIWSVKTSLPDTQARIKKLQSAQILRSLATRTAYTNAAVDVVCCRPALLTTAPVKGARALISGRSTFRALLPADVVALRPTGQ